MPRSPMPSSPDCARQSRRDVVVFNLKPGSRGIDAVPDLVLENGDRFIVPRAPSSVNVEGQVYSANAFLWQRGKRVKNYLELAGRA